MEKTWSIVRQDTMTPAADVTKSRFIGGDGDHCTAGGRAIGVSYVSADAGHEYACLTHGTAVVEYGGPINVGDEVESGTDGVALTLAAGKSNGIALDSGSLGDFGRVLVR